MDIRSLEELRQADEQTLQFTSLGLATGGKLRPEDAAVFQQEVISHAELVPAVAEGTRNTFERLRSLHAYGVLFYDIFTAVEDLTHLVIEQALRARFLEFHDGVVPFEDARGTVPRSQRQRRVYILPSAHPSRVGGRRLGTPHRSLHRHAE